MNALIRDSGNAYPSTVANYINHCAYDVHARHGCRNGMQSAKRHVSIRANSEGQFAPKRFYGSEEFFLYDMQTASMRSIWDAGISDNSVQGPLVSPNPTVKKISNGYTLILNVKDRSKSATETYKVRASYIRNTEKNGTHAVLTCTDLTAPKGENIEVGICEGTHPKLVPQ